MLVGGLDFLASLRPIEDPQIWYFGRFFFIFEFVSRIPPSLQIELES